MAVRAALGRLPWWASATLGVACAAFGGVLALRPFDSLAALVIGVAAGAFGLALASAANARLVEPRWPAAALAAVWLSAGVVALAWPDLTTRGLAVVVGVGLVASGVADVVAGLSGSADERLAALLGGAASAVFGLLALSWPSVTVLVVAVVFAFRLVSFGLRLAWSAARTRTTGVPGRSDPAGPRRGVRRYVHLVATAVALAAALALTAVSAYLHRGEPVLDAFYDAPDEAPDAPGVLVRVESFERTIPAGAEAWRILYTTTRDDGVAALASALVVVPAGRGVAPLPVIALAHGTTGVDRTCAPSALPDPFAAGAFSALDDVLARGWALVATDYTGLGTAGGHPYLVGEPAARSVLDSVRAAHQLAEVSLAPATVVWGHSQGGAAALWTGAAAPGYAPDVDLLGVAALAPASDLVALADVLRSVTGGSIFAAFIVEGFAAFYDDVRVADYVRPVARTTYDAVVGRCLAEPSVLLSAIGSVAVGDTVFTDLTAGPLLGRLADNVPRRPIAAPLLVAQGEADRLIVPSVQEGYVAERCAAGQPIDYRTYPGLDHLPLVAAGSPLIPELLAWTDARLAGVPATPTCGG